MPSRGVKRFDRKTDIYALKRDSQNETRDLQENLRPTDEPRVQSMAWDLKI